MTIHWEDEAQLYNARMGANFTAEELLQYVYNKYENGNKSAEFLGVSTDTFFKACKQYQIKIKARHGYPKSQTQSGREILATLPDCLLQTLTVPEIAKQLGVGLTFTYQLLKRMRRPYKKRTNATKSNPKERHFLAMSSQYDFNEMTISEITKITQLTNNYAYQLLQKHSIAYKMSPKGRNACQNPD